MGLGGNIAVADTERGSAALYSHLFDFDTVEVEPPYQIKKWIDIFDSAVEGNYNVLILDSITPLWSGEGGLLEMKEQLSKHSGKNSFTAWADVTPLYNKFVERMLNANIHIIATIRAKAEYAMETDGGRTVVKKIGLGLNLGMELITSSRQSLTLQATTRPLFQRIGADCSTQRPRLSLERKQVKR